MPDYSQSIEICSADANCAVTSACSVASSAARIERSRGENVAGSVAAVVDDDDDNGDENWSHFESWARARQRS